MKNGGLKMKGIVVFDTSHGNTKTIAETIAETLKESGIVVDTFYVKDVKSLSAKEYDFLVLGSPTKYWTMTFAMRSFLGKVQSKEWADKPFAAFDTEDPENLEKKRGSAAEKIAEKLREKQMKQPLPVLKAVVLGWKGPLHEGEIERAKQYARELAAKLMQG
jgi:flavodoxin